MFFVFLNLKLIGCFNSVLSFDWILGESAINLYRTQNDAIWELIALVLTNQIAGNTIDFKMNVISRGIEISTREKIPRDEDMRSVELKECLAKETSLVDKMKSAGEESKIKQLKEHTVEFEFLLKKMKSRVEAREMQLYSDTTKLELLLKNVKLEEKADGLE